MRFPIRFTGANHAMRILGLTPAGSWVEVTEDALRARMGWAFSMEAPLESVRQAQLDTRRMWGWGVHGWRGSWLVNGSSSGLVRIDLEPPAKARTGPFPVRVRELRVSVDDPRDSSRPLRPVARVVDTRAIGTHANGRSLRDQRLVARDEVVGIAYVGPDRVVQDGPTTRR